VKRSVARTTPSATRTRLLFTFATLFALSCINDGCIKRSHQAPAAINDPVNQSKATKLETNKQPTTKININTAPADELEKLPGIGKGLATRIVEHREKYGPFRKPEYLIIIRGISDKRFRALQDLITVE